MQSARIDHSGVSTDITSYLKVTRFRPVNLSLYCFLFQSAHLAMIDTLMMAYTVEMVSVEKVMACVRQYSSSDPDVETPYDTEDAVTTWVNKVGDGISQCVFCHWALCEMPNKSIFD